MLHSAASDLGLHHLPIALLGVSRLKWVKTNTKLIPIKMSSAEFDQIVMNITSTIKLVQKPDLDNINTHIKFGENSLIFNQVIVQKQKYRNVAGR